MSEQETIPSLAPTDVPTSAPGAAPSPATKSKLVEVRVLQVCELGQPNSLVKVPSPSLKGLKEAGLVDDDAAAVGYAKGLQHTGGDEVIE